MIIKPIKTGVRILSSPKEEFGKLNKRTLEDVVADYMKLLVTAGIAAGLFNLIYSLIRAFYLEISLNIDIQYWRMINYTAGRSISMIFLYLFIGTFILLFLSLILKVIFVKKIKYIPLIKILFYSLTPLLLFGWILPNPLPLSIWSIFLLSIGIKNHRPILVKKNSIQKRE